MITQRGSGATPRRGTRPGKPLVRSPATSGEVRSTRGRNPARTASTPTPATQTGRKCAPPGPKLNGQPATPPRQLSMTPHLVVRPAVRAELLALPTARPYARRCGHDRSGTTRAARQITGHARHDGLAAVESGVPIEQIAVMHGVHSDRSDRDQIRRHSLFYRSMAWCPAGLSALGARRTSTPAHARRAARARGYRVTEPVIRARGDTRPVPPPGLTCRRGTRGV
jgi:hypothetical protein